MKKTEKTVDGKIIIRDLTVLELYEREDVEIDKETGTPLIPSESSKCFGNGKHGDFECCCEECDHFLDCFPECEFDEDE